MGRNNVKTCYGLICGAERQLKRLQQSHRLLHAAGEASCHDFEHKGVLQKIETTALGLVTMMVIPMPGSVEVGAIGLGMLWLEGDTTSSHLALEHPCGVPLAPRLERLCSCPPPRASVYIAGWGGGGHAGVILVHNATPRRITAVVVADDNS